MIASVKNLDLKNYKRTIVLSDIHGDYEGFINVLNEIHFSNDDYLIIVGDILEKGKNSLKLLRKVMNMNNCTLVLGNNDTLFSDWKSGFVQPSDMIWYMNSREHSIFLEMANELNLEYQTEEDLKILEEQVFKTYPNEINFLNNCPYIVDTEDYIFVHAGIDPNKELNEQDTDTCISAPAFSNTKYKFEKIVIVGHWPASNYSKEKINVNSYYNNSNNILSIDGGNSMKSWQQINYLIIENNVIKYQSYDRCEKIKCLEKQDESKDPISLIFPNTYIEIKEKYELNSLCYIPYIDRELMIDNKRIYEYKRKTYCSDFTTYHLGVHENEIVSYCRQEDDGILIKKDGIVGLYKGRYEKGED